MAVSSKKILFVSSEIYPFVPETHISRISRVLPQGIQERKREIRSFMPRYGCINERKNQLHEVIRLSGMNIILRDVDRPLVIKVASIPAARMQVYFIDNEDYFKRKQMYADATGKFFADNAERAIFFARGVLETVKKLRWAPDIIHCHGWISHIVPLYLKKVFKDDPIFSSSKVVLSLYDDTPSEPFQQDFAAMAKIGGIGDKDLEFLAEAPTGINLAKTAAKFSDAVIYGSPAVEPEISAYCDSLSLPSLRYDASKMEGEGWIDEYNSFYDEI
jgi:starch synthase